MPLIVLEGLDGSGKTTQMQRLFGHLQEAGYAYRQFRDPGGTHLGEQVRGLLLDPANQVGQMAELFGYLLSRAQLVDECLRPALAQGEVVVLDRFWYSTTAYQCYGLGLPREAVQPAIDLAHRGLAVDCAMYLQLPAATALARRSAASSLDRIEARGADYLQRVADGYQALVAEGALLPIAAEQSVDTIAEQIWRHVQAVLT